MSDTESRESSEEPASEEAFESEPDEFAPEEATSQFNPDFGADVQALGYGTFMAMLLLVQHEHRSSGWNHSDSTGHVDGKLLRDIGPVKAGTQVRLDNTADKIRVSVSTGRETVYSFPIYSDPVYSFPVILQMPIYGIKESLL
jgi:hypothetical protein